MVNSCCYSLHPFACLCHLEQLFGIDLLGILYVLPSTHYCLVNHALVLLIDGSDAASNDYLCNKYVISKLVCSDVKRWALCCLSSLLNPYLHAASNLRTTRWSNAVTRHSTNLGIMGSNPAQVNDVTRLVVPMWGPWRN